MHIHAVCWLDHWCVAGISSILSTYSITKVRFDLRHRCGPCKVMLPMLVKLQEEQPDIKVYKLNCNKKNKELGVKLNVKVAPTFQLYKNSNKVNTLMPWQLFLAGRCCAFGQACLQSCHSNVSSYLPLLSQELAVADLLLHCQSITAFGFVWLCRLLR